MERRVVMWTGASITPEELEEFTNRGLVIDEQCAAPLSQVRAVVLRLRKTSVARVMSAVQTVANQASQQGALVLLLYVGEAADIVNDVVAAARCQVVPKLEPPAYEAAQLAFVHDPGRAKGTAVIDGDRVSKTQALLLKRAFDDCSHLTLTRIGGGRTGVAYRVHATTRSETGYTRPLPFFVKIASAKKIKYERSNYEGFVRDYVPFSCRPNLDVSRCIELPRSSGVLVGNFVEDAEPLGAIARRLPGVPLLDHLFDVALRGWRLDAFRTDDAIVPGKIPLELYGVTGRVAPDRDALAATLGATLTAAQVRDRLRNVATVKYRRGLIHGDLHCGNIMMRGRDAILIDFASVRRGPLVADPASLEVDLVCSSECSNDPYLWVELMERLYDPARLARLVPPALTPAPREWLWNAVRRVRAHALEGMVDGVEAYRQALATYFYRRATFRAEGTGDDKVADEFRRAYALVIAGKLLA